MNTPLKTNMTVDYPTMNESMYFLLKTWGNFKKCYLSDSGVALCLTKPSTSISFVVVFFLGGGDSFFTLTNYVIVEALHVTL